MRPLAILVAVLLALGVALPAPALAATPGAVYLPNVTKTLGGPEGWTTPIVVQNAGPTSTRISVALYRFSDGAFVTTLRSPLLLPAQGWFFDLAALPAVPDDTQFAAVVTADAGEVAAMTVEGSGRSWMSYGAASAGARVVFLPNITRRLGGAGGWDTPFIVQNLGAAAATASVSFYELATGALALRQDGIALAPGRSQAFSPWVIDGLADDRQYSVVVEGSPGAELFAIVNEHQAAQAMSYEGLTGGAETVYLPRIAKYLGGEGGWSTPFVVQNLGTAAATVSLTFHRADGSVAAQQGGIAVQPGRSHAADVRFAPAGLAAGVYSVVVRGNAGARLGAIVNQHELTANMAMSYQGITDARTVAYVPYAQKRNGQFEWSTRLVAQNAGSAASDIHVQVVDLGDGSVKAQKEYSAVAPGASVTFDLATSAAGSFLGYSALVTATAPVAVIADHQGTGGGDVAVSAPAKAHVFAVAPGVDLSRTGVSGRVLFTTGEPAPGIAVRALDWRGPGDQRAGRIFGATTTAADGTYSITGIPPGTEVGIMLKQQGVVESYFFGSQLAPVLANQLTALGDTQVARRYAITPAQGAVVPAGVPLTISWGAMPGATVYCVTLTDDLGRFPVGPRIAACGAYGGSSPFWVEVREPRLTLPAPEAGRSYWVNVAGFARTAFEVSNPELGRATTEFSAR